MDTVCPLCERRVSDTALAQGKTSIVRSQDPRVPPKVAHTDCLVDYKSKYGKEYGQ